MDGQFSKAMSDVDRTPEQSRNNDQKINEKSNHLQCELEKSNKDILSHPDESKISNEDLSEEKNYTPSDSLISNMESNDSKNKTILHPEEYIHTNQSAFVPKESIQTKQPSCILQRNEQTNLSMPEQKGKIQTSQSTSIPEENTQINQSADLPEEHEPVNQLVIKNGEQTKHFVQVHGTQINKNLIEKSSRINLSVPEENSYSNNSSLVPKKSPQSNQSTPVAKKSSQRNQSASVSEERTPTSQSTSVSKRNSLNNQSSPVFGPVRTYRTYTGPVRTNQLEPIPEEGVVINPLAYVTEGALTTQTTPELGNGNQVNQVRIVTNQVHRICAQVRIIIRNNSISIKGRLTIHLANTTFAQRFQIDLPEITIRYDSGSVNVRIIIPLTSPSATQRFQVNLPSTNLTRRIPIRHLNISMPERYPIILFRSNIARYFPIGQPNLNSISIIPVRQFSANIPSATRIWNTDNTVRTTPSRLLGIIREAATNRLSTLSSEERLAMRLSTTNSEIRFPTMLSIINAMRRSAIERPITISRHQNSNGLPTIIPIRRSMTSFRRQNNPSFTRFQFELPTLYSRYMLLRALVMQLHHSYTDE